MFDLVGHLGLCMKMLEPPCTTGIGLLQAERHPHGADVGRKQKVVYAAQTVAKERAGRGKLASAPHRLKRVMKIIGNIAVGYSYGESAIRGGEAQTDPRPLVLLL